MQKFLGNNNAEEESEYELDKIQPPFLFCGILSPGNLIKPKDLLPLCVYIIHNLHFQLKTLFLVSSFITEEFFATYAWLFQRHFKLIMYQTEHMITQLPPMDGK